jgi:cyclic pyranopterin phosphate synthase
MPAEGTRKVAHSDLLSLERLAEVVAWIGPRLGIERIKLTGGEPLVRRGIETLIRHLGAIPGVREVSLTTNGTLLAQKAQALRDAGLKRVTVSLDSMDASAYHEITRGGSLDQAIAGLEAARRAGLEPIKLNAVLLRSTWQAEIPRLLDYAAASDFEIRFIELMRTGTERVWCEGEFVPAHEVRSWLAAKTSLLRVLTNECAPARLTTVQWGNRALQVGWIAPKSQPFCDNCDRLRMDARGRVHRCLMDPHFFDLGGLLDGERDADAEAALVRYLAGKRVPARMDRPDAMSVIGG